MPRARRAHRRSRTTTGDSPGPGRLAPRADRDLHRRPLVLVEGVGQIDGRCNAWTQRVAHQAGELQHRAALDGGAQEALVGDALLVEGQHIGDRGPAVEQAIAASSATARREQAQWIDQDQASAQARQWLCWPAAPSSSRERPRVSRPGRPALSAQVDWRRTSHIISQYPRSIHSVHRSWLSTTLHHQCETTVLRIGRIVVNLGDLERARPGSTPFSISWLGSSNRRCSFVTRALSTPSTTCAATTIWLSCTPSPNVNRSGCGRRQGFHHAQGDC